MLSTLVLHCIGILYLKIIGASGLETQLDQPFLCFFLIKVKKKKNLNSPHRLSTRKLSFRGLKIIYVKLQNNEAGST